MNEKNEPKDVEKERTLPEELPAKTPTPKRTLRDVMADCVSALSLGPEELAAAEEYYRRKKTNPEPPDRPGGGRGISE